MDETPAVAAPERRPVSGGAVLFTLFLALLFGANPTAIKRGLAYVGPLEIAWLRFLLGGIAILCWARVTRRPLRPHRNELKPLAGLGLLFVVMIASTNLGQDRTTASHTVVIISAFPIWTAVFAHLFVPGDRLGRPQVIGVVLSYAGVLATFAPSLGEGGGALEGDALVFIASLLLGATQVYIALLAQRMELAKVVLVQAFSAVVLLFIASSLFEGNTYPFEAPLLASLVYQGLVVGGFGFIANGWLLKIYLPSRISVIYASQPLFGLVASWWVLGESIGPEVVLGAVLVMCGILMVQEVWTAYRRPAPAT